MSRQMRLRAAAAAAASVVLAVSAGAAWAASAPPPDLATVVLAGDDFGAAKVSSQTRTTIEGKPAYTRVFASGARLTGRPLLSAVSQAILDPTAAAAATDLARISAAARTTAGRRTLAAVWGAAFRSGAGRAVTLKQTVVGSPIPFGTGAIELPVTFATTVGTFRMAVVFVQVDRVFASISLSALESAKVARADVARAVSASRAHMQAAFTVASAAPPTVAGTAAQGQTLTADAGSWTGAPGGYTYAWSRCDASGAGCTPVAGATAAAYTVTAADVGFTLTVSVTGANTVSQATAASAPTAAVR